MTSPTKQRAYCFLVSNERRDFYLLLPIIYFLESHLNFTVSFEFVWDAHKISTQPPDLVILPNTRGHLVYYEIGNYCVENNIPLFNHDSEGNFNTTIPYDYWAFNQSKRPLTPVVMTWNERVKQFLMDRYQLNPNSITVTGAPGFDKYQYLPRKNKQAFLEKYGHTDKTKIIGYAGWAFGKLENKEINDILSNINKPGEAGKQWLIAQRDAVEDALKSAIERFPNFLFVLKKHPRENFESDLRDSRNEMNQLTHYPNVLYIKDEEEIQDLIELADLWTAFESTSIMEAWLVDTPTLLINPDPNFTRALLHTGSVSVKDSAGFLSLLEHVENDNFEAFHPLEVLQHRQEILSDAIGFADGLNHLRAVKAFLPFLNKHKKTTTNPVFNWTFFRRYVLLHVGKYFFHEALFKRLPKFKKTVWLYKNRTLHEINDLKPQLYHDLDAFYERKGLNKKIESGAIWQEL